MTANPIAGEIEVKAGGESYVLCYDFNALCALEDLFEGKTIVEIAAKLGEGMRLSDLRTIFAVGLNHAHGEIIPDHVAGGVIQAIGASKAATLMARAMSAAFPKEAAPKGGARPRRPARAGGTTKAP
jgi:hypothetical protein